MAVLALAFVGAAMGSGFGAGYASIGWTPGARLELVDRCGGDEAALLTGSSGRASADQPINDNTLRNDIGA